VVDELRVREVDRQSPPDAAKVRHQCSYRRPFSCHDTTPTDLRPLFPSSNE
jgi:hypothetical protein